MWELKTETSFCFLAFFARIFFSLASIVFRLFCYCIVYWHVFFHSLLCWYTRKHFQFCHWFETFSGRKIVGRNVFTALKLTEKSIMIFRECSEQKAMEQLPRKNDVFCINNLLQSHSPNAPSFSRCLSCSSAVRQCGRHFQLRNYYSDFLKCSDCFAFECCSKFIPFNGHEQTVPFFLLLRLCTECFMCWAYKWQAIASPIRMRMRMNGKYITLLPLSSIRSIPLLTYAISLSVWAFFCVPVHSLCAHWHSEWPK